MFRDPDSDRPVFKADHLNLFVAVETGDHHATILGGDRFVPLARFATHYALGSPWDMYGAIVVYEASTLEEVRRLPMNKPSGKYNLWNKITRSDGTSH